MMPGDLVTCSNAAGVMLEPSMKLMLHNEPGLVVSLSASASLALVMTYRGLLGWTLPRFLRVVT